MSDIPIDGLHSAAAMAGDGSCVVTFLGAVNSGVNNLASQALSITINTTSSSDPPPKLDSPHVRNPPRILAAASPTGLLVLTTDSLDTIDRVHAGTVEMQAAMCVGVAGTVVAVIRMAEMVVGRGLEGLLMGLEKSLTWRSEGIVSGVPLKRLIMVVVKDWEKEQVEESIVQEEVVRRLEEGYAKFELGGGFVGRNFAELFDVKVKCLVSAVEKEEWNKGVSDIGKELKDAGRQFANAGMTADGLFTSIEKVWGVVSGKEDAGVPEDSELQGSFGCGLHMNSALESFRNTSKQWRGTVESGRIIRNFGKECDKLIEETLQSFDQEATAHKGSRAFGRKRDELKSAMLAEGYVLFVKQTQKLSEVAYQVFRTKLARIRINDKVEKSVRGAVKQAEMYYVENAESLRSSSGGWRFDNERHELVTRMRDDATERLQLARLQGNYVPPFRAPIAFAFHTLLLAPFGRDSNTTYPNTAEMKQRYDPDKVKQAGLMRSRPTQRDGFKFKLKDRDWSESVELYQDLFEDAK